MRIEENTIPTVCYNLLLYNPNSGLSCIILEPKTWESSFIGYLCSDGDVESEAKIPVLPIIKWTNYH